MTLKNQILIGAAVAVLVIASLIWLALYNAVDYQKVLLGKPLPKDVAVFLAPGDLQGEFVIVFSDMYDDECLDKQNELFNAVVHVNQVAGRDRARMLHIGSHGFPANSYQDAAKKAPTAMIVANSRVIYRAAAIRKLPKPGALVLKDGKVSEVLVGVDFENWLIENSK